MVYLKISTALSAVLAQAGMPPAIRKKWGKKQEKFN